MVSANGKFIRTITMIDKKYLIMKDELITGMYFYKVINQQKTIAIGKLLVY